MAKIHEEIIIVKLSRLVKEGQDVDALVTEDLVNSLQAVVEELTGTPGVVVEIEPAQ
jgi:hypothetical protein